MKRVISHLISTVIVASTSTAHARCNISPTVSALVVVERCEVTYLPKQSWPSTPPTLDVAREERASLIYDVNVKSSATFLNGEPVDDRPPFSPLIAGQHVRVLVYHGNRP